MGKHRSAHRVPPRPRHFDNRRPGHCKFCGDPIINRHGKLLKRASWHPQCALRWTIMNNPTDARRFAFVRDRGRCADCKTDCAPGDEHVVRRIIEEIMSPRQIMGEQRVPLVLGEWELDHIIPLSQAHGDPTKWELANMQTLCPPCHKAKTARDREIYG